MHYVQVAVTAPLDQLFTYESAEPLMRGQLVKVPFGRRSVLGCVLASSEPSDKFKTKPIEALLPYGLSAKHVTWLEWIANYNMAAVGMVLKMMVPFAVEDFDKREPKPVVWEADVGKPEATIAVGEVGRKPLTDDQQQAFAKLEPYLSGFQPIIIDGITGSGKTEVYVEAIQRVLNKGKQILVMLPEIALTKQWIERFEQAFGVKPFVWNSSVSAGKKRALWRWALSGELGVMVGARSALFLPYQNLGLMVMDEEHDASYKQEEQVIYHARDMAVVRAKMEDVPLILASATPSLETMENVERGRYVHVKLTKRYGQAQLPEVELVSTQELGQDEWITAVLRQEIQKNIERGEQTLLFLNRRGYAPLLLCRGCGFRFACRRCDATLVWHKNLRILTCHYCGHQQEKVDKCPKCASGNLLPCGPGVERIIEVMHSMFPEARIEAVTSDVISNAKVMADMWQRIEDGHIDIVVGTQMLAKGHNFPNLTLVGVVDGDIGLGGSDLRAAETSFQLIQQVSGRAGRFEKKGRVMIQTSQVNHPMMVALAAHDRDQFYDIEMGQREEARMPPYGRLVALILSGPDHDQVQRMAYQMSRVAPRMSDVYVLGPVAAPIAKIRNKYRWRFLVRAPKQVNVQAFVRQWLAECKLPPALQLTVDVDPYNFL